MSEMSEQNPEAAREHELTRLRGEIQQRLDHWADLDRVLAEQYGNTEETMSAVRVLREQVKPELASLLREYVNTPGPHKDREMAVTDADLSASTIRALLSVDPTDIRKSGYFADQEANIGNPYDDLRGSVYHPSLQCRRVHAEARTAVVVRHRTCWVVH